MIRAIILCCDEKSRRMSFKDVPTAATRVDASSNTVTGYPGYPNYQGAGAGEAQQGGSDPSPGRSYGDGLNCGYMQERFSYSSGLINAQIRKETSRDLQQK